MLNVLSKIGTSKLTNLIPLEWKLNLRLLLSRKKIPAVAKSELKIIITVAAHYGNLGDISITHAQKQFLMEHFPGYRIMTLYANDFGTLLGLKKVLNERDIITIIGGGNMGDVYEGLEIRRRQIIKLFHHHKVISFPQTIEFKTEKSLMKSIKIYGKHPNLHLFAREPKSFETMKKHFIHNHVYLVPDIVLSLDESEPSYNRDGVLICLRNDRESKIAKQEKDHLIECIQLNYQKVEFYDTHIGSFPKDEEEEALKDIWQAFKRSKVVVTDRLHGMIFCAITKTPCIVLPNSNHKISGTYQKWLNHLNYIIFIKLFDENQIYNQINKLMTRNADQEFVELDLVEKFQPLVDVLKNWPF